MQNHSEEEFNPIQENKALLNMQQDVQKVIPQDVLDSNTDQKYNNSLQCKEEQLQTQMAEARKLLNKGETDESIGMFETILEEALKLYNDELNYNMAQYYYAFGNALLCLLEEQQDFLGAQCEQKQKSEGDDEQTKGNIIAIKEDTNEHEDAVVIQDEYEKEEDQKEEQQKNNLADNEAEEQDYQQLAWESLDTTRVILEKHLNNDENGEELSFGEKLKTKRQMGSLQLRMGDFELIRENFAAALEYYNNCLQIRLDTEDLLSRGLAEVYFLIGNVHCYIAGETSEEDALFSYGNARKILENLKSSLQFERSKDTKSENNTSNTVTADSFNNEGGLVIDRSGIAIAESDTSEISDIKLILKQVYDKMEDTHLQKVQKKQILIELQKLREPTTSFDAATIQSQIQQEHCKQGDAQTGCGFAPMSEAPKKIIHLGTFGNGAQKQTQHQLSGTTGNAIQKQQDETHVNDQKKTNNSNDQEEDNEPMKKIKLS